MSRVLCQLSYAALGELRCDTQEARCTRGIVRAPCRNRTDDTSLTMAVLCRLS
jgi:hypothetical protein